MPVGLTVTRTIAAPPERVYAAWTRPEDFAVWFGSNAVDVPVESVSMDVRVGGRWTAVMHPPGGDAIYWHGRYTEVDPPRRLAFTMDDDPESDTVDPVVVTLAPASAGSQMSLAQPRGDLTDEQLAQTVLGYNAFFDSLEILLAGRD